MVARQIARRGVRDRLVLAAMRNVPRHWFVPAGQARNAYADRPLPIGYGQTISQPYIVALMTELLRVEPGQKVLEIGTGSGYQAAVLAELTDQVFTIEIVARLARRTIKLLEEKGYRTIRTRIGDGYRGWPEQAPFDAIIVTCAPESPPPPLVEQLAVGGRMCIPVGSQWGGQELIVLQKRSDGTLGRHTVERVRFVPMTGEAEGKDP
jgi:protein-L-isoaspartate(D-aspartate) O-methyltransferase